MLQPIKLLLSFDLLAQLLLGRHIEHILRGEQTVVVVQDGVTGNIFVGLRTEDDTDGRIVALAAYPLVIHSYIHIHLPDVLVRNGRRFEVDQYERFENVVVENKVDEVVLLFGADQFLPCDE